MDGNIITSRAPKDLPAFGEAMVRWLAKHKSA
jgi:putative intracellular protease/amidase